MKFETLFSLFSELGLSKKETEFLQALIKHREATLAEVIKLTHMTKPTAYRIFRSLVEHGLVRSDQKKYQQTVSACSAGELLEFAAKQQRRVRRVELKIKQNMDSIQKYLRNPLSIPEITRYTGDDGYSDVAEETLDEEHKEVRYFGNLDDIYRVISPEYDQKIYVPERIKKNILLKMLVYPSPQTKKLQQHDRETLRETRFIENKDFFSASFLIAGDRIYFLSHSDESVAVKITSTSISSMFRHIFDQFWQTAVP